MNKLTCLELPIFNLESDITHNLEFFKSLTNLHKLMLKLPFKIRTWDQREHHEDEPKLEPYFINLKGLKNLP